jgi:hypothetical protein
LVPACRAHGWIFNLATCYAGRTAGCGQKRTVKEICGGQVCSSLEPLIRKWRTADIGVLPPYGEAIIRSTFLEAGIEPSKDLITLYSAIGGMESDDRNLWRLWSLSETDGRKAEPNKFGVLFSDYLLESWVYRVKPISKDVSAIYVDYFDGKASILVATSLEQFFSLYAANADKLLTQVG